MKSIKLNESDRFKILEMSNQFTKYGSIIIIRENGNDICVFKTKDSSVSIPWYEFVINHLADKVFQMKSLSPIHLMNQKKKFGSDIMCGIEPIEYLYQIFKTTK